MSRKIEKATAFLNARGQHSKAFDRFHVRVDQGQNGDHTRAVVYSPDLTVVYAEVTVAVDPLEEGGLNHRVYLSFPGRNDTHTNLRHTFLAAVNAVCDLAEAVDAHLRTGL